MSPTGKVLNQNGLQTLREELGKRSPQVLAVFRQRLQQADPDQRHWVFQTAARFPWADSPAQPEFRPALEKLLRGDDADGALLAAAALARMQAEVSGLVDRLTKALDDADLPRQDAAVATLGACAAAAGPAVARLAALLETRWSRVAAERNRGKVPWELQGGIPLTPGQPEWVVDALVAIGPAAKDAGPLLRKIRDQLTSPYQAAAENSLLQRTVWAIYRIEEPHPQDPASDASTPQPPPDGSNTGGSSEGEKTNPAARLRRNPNLSP